MVCLLWTQSIEFRLFCYPRLYALLLFSTLTLKVGICSVAQASRTDIDTRRSIASLIAPVIVPDDQAGHIRASQLHSISKLGVLAIVTNLLCAMVLMVMFWGQGSSGFVGLWGSVMCLACAFHFMQFLAALEHPEQEERSGQSVDRYTRGAFLFGVLWGVCPIIMLPGADAKAQVAVASVALGMVFGGAFIMARLPRAALAFVMPILFGLAASLTFMFDERTFYLGVLLALYATLIVIGIRWNYNQFVSQHLSESENAQQSALIRLLLRDFEESTSDWLWQTDAEGVLVDLPLSVGGAKSGYELMAPGRSLLDLFETGDPLNVLRTSLERRQSFRDLVLKVTHEGEERWWSITGKPIHASDVFAGFRGVASDVTQSKRIEDRIAYLAHYDGLTGLPNRAAFQETLERACQQPVHPDHDRAVLWMDLDNFKWVNDTLGHPAGDELLRQFAGRLSAVCEAGDVVARLGGDEFALIVERAKPRGLRDFLDTLVTALSRPYDIWGSTANCSASVGMRRFTSRALDPSTMLSHADLALYQAKKNGKGAWAEFSRELEERALARRVIEVELHDALKNDEFGVAFQPIISARTREVVNCEALMRWQHPNRGWVAPSQFIEHAEDCGLISRMGDWVIREALSQAARLPSHVGVSVNISPLQLHSANLLNTIVNALATNKVDPSRLDLEITESVLLSDTDFVRDRLQRFKEIGLKITLDDFGTGFSSLTYLRSFPFDKIKIDKSFVSDLETNEDSRAITLATISLAKSLSLRCTAEGVETEAQSSFLVAHGCDELQGFLISRAKSLDELRHLVDVDPTPSPRQPVEGALRLVSGPEGRPVGRERRRATK